MKKIIEITEKQEMVIMQVLEKVNNTLKYRKYTRRYQDTEKTIIRLTPAEKRSLSSGIEAISNPR